MASDGDPRALGELLRSRRERLAPADVGLPPGARRRTPGLRREEVAQLASMSVTYYTFLEQGRQARPSEQVLDALAAALRMTRAERRYLLTLAYGPDETAPAGEAGGRADGTAGAAPPAERVSPGVADLVRRLEPSPTLVKGRCWDVLAANPAARELFGDWSGTRGTRNLVRWMFTSDAAREIYLEWEPEARAMLGRFRLAAARHPGDQRVARLIAELRRDSPEVRDWWPAHHVTPIGGEGVKKLRHPRFGPAEYSHVILQVADNPDQVLVSYSLTEGNG
jgi:transcriptional regulator with XRE-family HTH domain